MSELDRHGITLVVHGLRGGGGERVVANLASYWAKGGRKVALITHAIHDDENYTVDEQVKRIALSDIELPDPAALKEKISGGFWKNEEEIFEKLKIALERAGNKSVIVFMNRIALRVLTANDSDRYDIWISEQNHPPMYKLSGLMDSMRRKLYPQARGLMVLAERTKNEWARDIVEDSKIHVIPNFLPEHDSDSAGKKEQSIVDQSREYIFACGRLVEQKGFDLLLEAYAKALKVSSAPLPDLKIAGGGDDLHKLKDLAEKLKIKKRVSFLGQRSDVLQLMSNAVCFVLSSRHEGFGIVIIEAMASGTPVISFDCPAGPDEIITDRVDGILVETGNTNRLADAIVELCGSEKLRSDLAANALRTKDRYSLKNVASMWEKVIWEGERE